jgi:hypothetical protein
MNRVARYCMQAKVNGWHICTFSLRGVLPQSHVLCSSGFYKNLLSCTFMNNIVIRIWQKSPPPKRQNNEDNKAVCPYYVGTKESFKQTIPLLF